MQQAALEETWPAVLVKQVEQSEVVAVVEISTVLTVLMAKLVEYSLNTRQR
jgi:hypothetical protein